MSSGPPVLFRFRLRRAYNSFIVKASSGERLHLLLALSISLRYELRWMVSLASRFEDEINVRRKRSAFLWSVSFSLPRRLRGWKSFRRLSLPFNIHHRCLSAPSESDSTVLFHASRFALCIALSAYFCFSLRYCLTASVFSL